MPLERFLELADAVRGTTSRHSLREFPAVIGRATDAHVQLPFDSVSRRHAEIGRNTGGRLTIRDLGSTNGTFVNGTRIDRVEALLAGDVIHIGDVELRLAESVNTLPPDDDAATRMGLNVSGHSPIPVREFAELLDQELVTGYRQPIVGRDGRAIGYELLGRGTHPSLSEAPGVLFGLAEMAQQEARLSRLMRRRCFDEAARARLNGRLFFNTHPAECVDPAPLLEELRRLRKLFPDLRLVFEVHEKAVTDLARMAEIRDELVRLEIELAYDDFGAGQARLRELVEVPPHYLKFDMSLVRGVGQPESPRYRMLESLNSMIRALGISTLAEGVEDAADASACKTIGIDYFQGFYFGRPEPINSSYAKIS